MTQQGRDLFAEMQGTQQAAPQQAPVQQAAQPAQQGQGRDLFAAMQQPQQEQQFVPFGAVPPREQQTEQQQALAALQGGELATGLWNAFTGGDKQTEESLRTPELIEAPAADVGAALGFNLATNFDPIEIKSVIRENLPLATFREDRKGNEYVDIAGQEYLLNRPGLSRQDLGATLGNIMATLPAAKIASLGKSVLGRLTLGGGGAAATEFAIQSGQASTGGEFDAGEVGLAGALGAAGELPAAIRNARMSDQARGMIPQITDAQAEFARDVRQRTGVELMPNQVTGSEYDNLVALAIRRNPEQAQRFTDRLRKQSTDVYAGVSNLLNELATSGQSETAAAAVRRASVESLEQANRVRAERTRPLYNAAFSNARERQQVIDVSDTIQSLDPLIDEASGTVKNALEQIQTRLREASVPSEAGTNVQRLHNLKRALFADRDRLRGDGVLDNELIRTYNDVYGQVRDRLVQEVPEYNVANTTFRNLSPAVDELQDGIIGNLANVNEDKLKSISNLIFDWRETNANPAAVRNAKQIIREVNPDAWNALVRNKIERDLGEIGIASTEEAADTTVNFLQKLYSKTFSGRDKSMLMNALEGDQRANFNALAEAVERGRNRPGQSATAQLQDIEQALNGSRGVTGVLSMLMSGPQEMVNRALNVSTNREQNSRMLASIIIDPQWMDRVSEIRKMGMQTPRGGAAFAQLFRDALNEQQQAEEAQ